MKSGRGLSHHCKDEVGAEAPMEMHARRKSRPARRSGKGFYVYLGGETAILSCDVVAILDARCPEKSKETRHFLDQAKLRGAYRDVSGGTINSYVITDSCVYSTAIAPQTLKRRIEGGLIEALAGLTVPEGNA